MAHQKPKQDSNVITVRWTGSTYAARIDGERMSSTAAPIIAARRLAASVLCIPPDHVNLHTLEENLNGISKYKIFN